MSHAVIRSGAIGGTVNSEGSTDEDTTDDVLVVQIRGLGAIHRDVLQLAAREALVTARGRIRRGC